MDDEETCKHTISEINKILQRESPNSSPGAIFKGPEEEEHWPPGCYLYVSGIEYRVYFNKYNYRGALLGSRNKKARHICRVPGKKT